MTTNNRHLAGEVDYPTGRYRLRGVMTFDGAPVEWNARARIWSATDHRAPLRRALRRLGWWLPSRWALHRFLLRVTDDRVQQRYTARVTGMRRLLNTDADVEARRAWTLANRYWAARGHIDAERAEVPAS